MLIDNLSTAYRGSLTKRTVCPAPPPKPLLHAACREKIYFHLQEINYYKLLYFNKKIDILVFMFVN